MNRKILISIVLGVVLVMAQNVWAANVWWDGGGSGDLFSTPGNWDNDSAVNSSDDYIIDGYSEPLVDSTVDTQVYRLKVGLDSTSLSKLTIEGGQLIAGYYTNFGEGSGSNGLVEVSGGTFYCDTSVNVGVDGYGKITITGGKFDWQYDYSYYLTIDAGSGGGLVELFGGSMAGSKLSIGDNGLLHIKAGTMILTGDWTSDIDTWIGQDKIIAYDGTGTVMRDYDTETGLTTMWAVPEPTTMVLFAIGGLSLIRRRKQ